MTKTAASDRILERLKALHPKVIDLSLGRIERLLAALGHPERRLPPVIHVAGTNGKGSTVAFLRAMLEAAGRRCHVYTSPHLVRFNERIRIAGALANEDELSALLEECERANAGAPITFFEITTAAALLAFSRAPAEAVLLETGLGGRLDATNVVPRPVCTIVTPVDMDHMDYLGDTLTKIAGEKAGIIKTGAPAVFGPQQDAALEVLTAAAARVGAPVALWGQDYMAHEEHGRMVYQDGTGLLDLPLPRLPGRHQIANAAQAIAALRLCPSLGAGAGDVERGLSTARWPARLQRLTKGPLIEAAPDGAEVWLDGGHNPHAARALAEALADMEDRDSRPLYLIAGMLSTKDAAGFFAPFRGLARHVTTVTIPGEAASLGAGALYDIVLGAGLNVDPASDLEDAMALTAARATGETPPRILICGSLYLAGKVLADNG